MTTERDFNRIARAWLEMSPDEVPDGVIAAVLDAVAATPQVGGWRRSAWRPFRMNRLVATLAAAALVAAVGGVIVLNRTPTPSIGGPTASPRSTASATPTPPPSLATAAMGELAAGTYQTVDLDVRTKPGAVSNGSPVGNVTFTVPDGWAKQADDRSRFGLEPAVAYTNPDSVAGKEFVFWIFSRIEAASQDVGCPYEGLKPSVGTSPDAYVNWIAGLPSVKASAIHDITIDGHPGRWLDVEIATKWNRSCPWTDGSPYVPLFFIDRGANGLFGVGGREQVRFVLIDIGDGTTVLVEIQSWHIVNESSDKALADHLMSQAMKIMASLHFR